MPVHLLNRTESDGPISKIYGGCPENGKAKHFARRLVADGVIDTDHIPRPMIRWAASVDNPDSSISCSVGGSLMRGHDVSVLPARKWPL